MQEVSKIRERWYRMQREISQQAHPIFQDQPLLEPGKLPVITEADWRRTVMWWHLRITQQLENYEGLTSDHWDNWRKVQMASYRFVADFEKDLAALLEAGKIDDRHIDPSLATDEEVEALAEQLEAKLAEIADPDAMRSEWASMQAEMVEFRENGLEAYARKLLSQMNDAPDVDLSGRLDDMASQIATLTSSSGGAQRPFADAAGDAAVAVPVALDEAFDAVYEKIEASGRMLGERITSLGNTVSERCSTGVSSKIDDLEEMLHANGEMLEKHRSDIGRLNGLITPGGVKAGSSVSDLPILLLAAACVVGFAAGWFWLDAW